MGSAMQTILVVEDNRDNMVLIMDVLGSLKYEVITASDGEEGVSAAETHHPDLILMDLSLPRKSGWTAAREIKSCPALAHVPIIALTAHAMVGDRDRALEAGCDGYLSKPVNIKELAETIRRLLAVEHFNN
jgi:two-component system, cell cycle response regulator DivK